MAKKQDNTVSEGSSNSTSAPSWLLSFGASNIGIQSGKQGKITFVMDSENVSPVTLFTDRPDRITGQWKMKKLARNFKNMFDKDYPNASITHWTDGKFYNGVFEVKSVKRRKNNFYLKSDILLEEHAQGSLAHDPLLADMSSLVDDFAATNVIKNANFFLDGFSFPCIEGVTSYSC